MPWKSVTLEALNPRLGRKLIVGKDIMLARVFLAKGCIVPEHSHPNEQLTYILQGALKFWIAGKEIVVRAGEVLTIPPNMPHKAKALEHTDDLDIFTPPRADWMSGYRLLPALSNSSLCRDPACAEIWNRDPGSQTNV